MKDSDLSCADCRYLVAEREGISLDSHATVLQAIEFSKDERCYGHKIKSKQEWMKFYFDNLRAVVNDAGKE